MPPPRHWRSTSSSSYWSPGSSSLRRWPGSEWWPVWRGISDPTHWRRRHCFARWQEQQVKPNEQSNQQRPCLRATVFFFEIVQDKVRSAFCSELFELLLWKRRALKIWSYQQEISILQPGSFWPIYTKKPDMGAIPRQRCTMPFTLSITANFRVLSLIVILLWRSYGIDNELRSVLLRSSYNPRSWTGVSTFRENTKASTSQKGLVLGDWPGWSLEYATVTLYYAVQVQGMWPNFIHTPVFQPNYCALSCHPTTDWLIDWAHLVLTFFLCILEDYSRWCGLIRFIRRVITMKIGKLDLAEFGRLVFGKYKGSEVRWNTIWRETVANSVCHKIPRYFTHPDCFCWSFWRWGKQSVGNNNGWLMTLTYPRRLRHSQLAKTRNMVGPIGQTSLSSLKWFSGHMTYNWYFARNSNRRFYFLILRSN